MSIDPDKDSLEIIFEEFTKESPLAITCLTLLIRILKYQKSRMLSPIFRALVLAIKWQLCEDLDKLLEDTGD